MTKKQLYIIIAVLCGVLLYVLFMSTAPATSPEVGEVLEESVVADEKAQETTADVEEEVAEDLEPEQITLTGSFVGLLDGEDPFQKKFKYLLLNDGEEVLRIDLRPLVGYSDINIIKKLGVDRGDEVKVMGVMNGGEFKVESIE